MGLDERAGKLCQISLFADLDEDALHRISGLMTEFDCPAGMVLMQSGAAGSGLLLIEEGTVVVSTRNGDIELGPGECVGELALLDDRGTHAARVRAKTDVSGHAIDRGHFMDMLGAEPRIALAMLRVLAHRLSDAIHK
jgi:CRP/FNR family cyclic AMP-dependent transcriptional regulator